MAYIRVTDGSVFGFSRYSSPCREDNWRRTKGLVGLGQAVDGGVGPNIGIALNKATRGVAVRPIITTPAVSSRPPDARLTRFDKRSAKIKDFHVPDIDRVADEIVASRKTGQPIFTVYVKGHTSSEGSAQSNISLGLHRALAVRKALQKALESREKNLSYKVLILAQSKGPREPIDTNDTEEGKSQNRRVEVFLSKKKLLPKRTPLPVLQAFRDWCLNAISVCNDRNALYEKLVSDCGADSACEERVRKAQQSDLDECARILAPCQKLFPEQAPAQLAYAPIIGWRPRLGSTEDSWTAPLGCPRAGSSAAVTVHGVAGVPGAEWADWCSPCVRGWTVCHAAELIAPEPPQCIGIFGNWYRCRC